MKFDKIYYQRIFPLGPYINERIGVEILIEDGESPEAALAEAKKFVGKLGSELENKIQMTQTDNGASINEEWDMFLLTLKDASGKEEAESVIRQHGFWQIRNINPQIKEILYGKEEGK